MIHEPDRQLAKARARRTFLALLLPVLLLLACGLLLQAYLLRNIVRGGVRDSLLNGQRLSQRSRTDGQARLTGLLLMVAAGPDLQAALRPESAQDPERLQDVDPWRQTGEELEARWRRSRSRASRWRGNNGEHQPPDIKKLETQLGNLAGTTGVDLALITGPDQKLLAGILRSGHTIEKLGADDLPGSMTDLVAVRNRLFLLSWTPVRAGQENLGMLAAGRAYAPPPEDGLIVLERGNQPVFSNFIPSGALREALARCEPSRECEVTVAGERFLSVPVPEAGLGSYGLRAFQSIDVAWAPIEQALLLVGACLALGAALIASILALASWKSVEPVVEPATQPASAGPMTQLAIETAAHNQAEQFAAAFRNAVKAMSESRTQLEDAYIEFGRSMVQALEARDAYTAGHSRRVSSYAHGMAREMQLPESQAELIRVGALLHDIGKIGVPDAILSKTGLLTEEEFDVIRQHPVIGQKILAGLGHFDRYLPIVELHHENYDGTGYPHGLRGEQVPLEARIVHVADAFDAMTSDRPYRPGMPWERVVVVLREGAGTQFDPIAVRAFIQLVESGRIRIHAA